ncbi:hypothetical protein Y1Q_0007928 [Alligator mississippiensis]|uniref:Uncharacterized protein n=1 Tax=Alligator mississippiensis TaxID=8496 RepID=A0A151NF17_ALLMI|nr:hypothetical protein Y1Q_0007928 [Alligator mississippiensis]
MLHHWHSGELNEVQWVVHVQNVLTTFPIQKVQIAHLSIIFKETQVSKLQPASWICSVDTLDLTLGPRRASAMFVGPGFQWQGLYTHLTMAGQW